MLSITHVASMATRSIMILYLVFKTSKVKADLVNVALGKRTSQFEKEPSTTEIWPSSNAVDGEKECTAVTKKFYTLTAESHDPWWMVNLGDQFRIQEVIVHGRHDNITNQLHGFRLYLSLNNRFDENNIVYTNRDYNNGTIYITQNLTGVFQYVRLDLPDTFRGETAEKDGKQSGPLVLCEVEVLVNITNIALGNPASMSTVYGSMTADKSVDGSLRGDAKTCNCCSHSQNEANPWLKIRLLHSYKIYRITVIGRSDDNRDNRMIGGLEIYTDNSQNLAVGNNTIANNSVVTVYFPSGTIASNVVLKRPRKQGNSEWYLVVCEVKIYTIVSVCLAGTYRDYIENQCKSCGHCKTQPCNKDTGTCPGGVCMAGWTGAVCNTACDDGFYGQNCSLNCSGHCKGGVHQCNKTNGKCMQGCVDGYTGERCETECQDGYFGDCTHRCHCKDDLPCLKTDGVCTENCTFGWGGKNCSIDLSLIRQLTHVVTNQTGMYETYDSSKAIDRKDQYDVNKCNCCSVTNGIVPSWWQIDLGDKYLIDAVKIYGRSDIGDNNYQLENATVYASNQTMVNNNVSQTLIYRIPTITKSTVFTHHLKTSTIAQFFIVKSVKKILTVCEFNLFRKVCDVGKFGTGCSHTCHCSDNKSCDSITGKCKEPGCFPGWKGESCNLKCESHSFGKNCSQKCQCINETNCDNVNGQCDERECAPGWIECDSRSFGKNCNHTCHCVNGTNCDHVNGQCDKHECDPGWTGASCETECESKSFGKNCSQTCHCINGTHCDNVNGYCDKRECDPGWTGESCQTERQSSKENSKSSSAAIGGGIGAAMALVIIAVIIGFIIYRRRNVKDSSDKTNKFTNLDKALDSRRQRLSERHVPSMNERVNRSFEGEEETAMTQSGSGDYYSFGDNFGVRTFELWDYIRKKMENKCEKLYSEFQTLPSGLMYPCKSAENLVNKGKHRYKEMYAYDHSRVVLEVEEGTHTDYINACYIDGYDKTKKFVASQGPTKQMINDFWRMVWQLKSDKIVMLTDLIEMGTVKCLQYWPLEDEEEEHCFGKVIVKVLNTESFLDYNIRLFEVRKNGESARRIRQFHFKSWPDKDVPDSTWCLVSFWRAVNTNEPSTAGPIVVHCSAGVGRTGTFIALDNLVSQAKAEGCVRPLQIVEALRRQRVNMVQTREQYVYLHEAVADALLFGTHYVFTKQFGEMFSFMLRKGKGETKSNLEKQFELIEKSTRDTSAGAAENVEYTNVETIQSESEAYRPKLKNRGSRYVQRLGAMYIPNYKGKNTFLISMSPDKNTMEEFWSLVDDSHIKTIIMLTETSAPCYQASCQLGANSKNGSKFSVNKIEEKIRKGFTERSFCFKESDREEEEYLTTVKQFEYTDWKDGSAVPGETKHMLDMINSIQKWQSYLSESQPILIHCSDGCKWSGIICVLLNELQRIQYEGGLVNILESVKMMKKRQKFLIPTYEEYRFCFDLILAHLKSTEVYANI